MAGQLSNIPSLRAKLEKPRNIAKFLKKGKLYQITTNNGEWIIYNNNRMPFLIEHNGDDALLHRHIGAESYHFQCKSEWNTGSGIVELIQYILKHDYEYYQSDNQFIIGKVVSISNVIPLLPFDKIQKDLDDFIVDQGMSPYFCEDMPHFLHDYFVKVETYKQLIPSSFYNNVKKIKDETIAMIEQELSDMLKDAIADKEFETVETVKQKLSDIASIK